MSLPFDTVDTTFKRFLQELPADFRGLAFEFEAFARGRKIKTLEQLLQLVINQRGCCRGWRESERIVLPLRRCGIDDVWGAVSRDLKPWKLGGIRLWRSAIRLWRGDRPARRAALLDS